MAAEFVTAFKTSQIATGAVVSAEVGGVRVAVANVGSTAARTCGGRRADQKERRAVSLEKLADERVDLRSMSKSSGPRGAL